MIVHAKSSLNAKTDLLLIEAASSGGGQWGRPAVLRLVEFPAGMEYTTVRNPNAKQVASVFVDARHQGPRSHFCQMKQILIERMAKRGSVTMFA